MQEYEEWIKHPQLPPRPTEPFVSYFICSVQRSGSWLLSGLLASTGAAGRPHEWFYPGVEMPCRQAWRAPTFAAYLEGVRAAATTENGVLGVKIHWTHFAELVPRLDRLGSGRTSAWTALIRARGRRGRTVPAPHRGTCAAIDAHFPRVRYLWIRRKDVAAQAVSFAKAIQSNSWHRWNGPSEASQLAYDRNQIDTLRQWILTDEAAWEEWFSRNRIEPLLVVYEDLVADPQPEAERVLRYLGVAGAQRVSKLTASYGDSTNEEWLRRYRSGA